MHKQLEFWKGRLVHNLLAAFPEGTVESVDWTTCRILFPHVQLAVAQPPAEDSAMIDWVKILNVAADYAITRRDISEEIRLLEQAVLTLRENVGPAREETLAATNDLAVAYINEQYYDASESLLLEALQETKTTLGPEHTESLISMAWLSRVYFLQGHLEAAYNLQMDVLNLCHQKMATNLPRISACILGILYVYRDQGQYDQGVLLLSEALTASIGSLGPHHHVTLTYRILLGQLYSLQGNWEAAVSVLEGLLDIQSAMLGADHPVTLGCLGALAWEYLWHAKRYDEAGSMYWQLVEEYKTLFGEDHLDTIKTLDALARALEGQGKYGDAEIMGQRALEGLERAYGDDNHPKILKRLESQASVLWHLGKYDEAMILADRAMWGRRRVLGDKHPDTLECIWTKANMLRSTRQLGEAYHVFSVAMDGYRSLLEPDHPTMQAFMKDYREYWKEVEQTQAQPNFELLHGPPEEEVSVWNYILAALIILAHAENW
jgi:tetratricopeptide (TPR) repeat protein